MERAPTSPPAPAAPPERGPDSPAGRAAAAALVALARTARSFVLYDANNAVVRQLLGDFGEKMRAALDLHGPLEVEVRPFELRVRGEVAYADPDREKSLAFKLHRDGVRRLTFARATPWDELLRLVQILAVRFTSVRQAEEDVVTLLRGADLAGISVVAIAGYVLADDGEEDAAPAAERAAPAELPPGWDTPLPLLPQPGPVAWREVPAAALAPLAADEDDAAVAELALGLVRDLLAEAERGGWPAPHPDLVELVAEVRDALLADGQLAPLRRLVELIDAAGDAAVRDALLRGLGDARTLDLVLAAVPAETTALPADLVPFLPLLGIVPALERLADPALPEPRGKLLAKIVAARLPRDAELVLARLPALEPRLARDLARAVVHRAPERAAEVARALLATSHDALRVEGLAALEASRGSIPVRPVCELLRDASQAVRVRAAELLGRRGDESAVEALCAALDVGRELDEVEAAALGRALAGAAPVDAARHFAAWAQPPRRFLLGPSAAQRNRQRAARAGSAALSKRGGG